MMGLTPGPEREWALHDNTPTLCPESKLENTTKHSLVGRIADTDDKELDQVTHHTYRNTIFSPLQPPVQPSLSS